jgi:hypothetical protein
MLRSRETLEIGEPSRAARPSAMSLPSDPAPRAGALPSRLGAAALLVAAIAGFAGTLVPSDDPDMFHHLAMGREILRSGLPETEPFLFPHRGEATGTPLHWLGSVAVYGAHAALGEVGLSILPAVVGALLAIVLLLDAAPRGARHGWATLAAAAGPVALALETYRYRAVARPEIFSAVLLAFAMWAIRRHEEGRSRALLALPVLVLLGTNLHAGAAVALVPLAVHVATGAAHRLGRRALRLAPRGPAWRAIGVAVAVLAAATLASAASPSAASPVAVAVRFALATLRIGGSGGAADPAIAGAVASVGELQGGGLALFRTPVGALLVLTALSFLPRPREIRLRELLTFAAFAVLPFHAVRFAMFLAIVAAPIAARNLGVAVAALPARAGRVPVRAAAAAALAAGAVATLPLGALAPHIRFGAGLTHGAFPVRGTEYLRALGVEVRIYNTFELGGYLEWAGLSPFQDGRGGAFPADEAAARAGPTQRWLFADLDRRYRFDALLVTYPAGNPFSAARFGIYDPDPGTWALVAFDDAALLYLRRDGRHAAAASRDEYRFVRPADPVAPVPADAPAETLRDLRRSVREAPDCWRCRYWLGEVALAASRPEEALETATPILARAYGDERELFRSIVARASAQAAVARGARPVTGR